ncbi:hypothetical protein [Nocardia suismassiliense]|uniref:hypothetical protein n=1 Tax=Nocardia suismassiliense TaxID=2077092 RepID=UPI000D1F93A4|nr:hypothetical protein [Nocardia suismassiliense]
MGTRPSADRIKVVTSDLRAEAGIWIRESETLTAVSNSIAELKFNRPEAGLFQAFVTTHSELVQEASDRCKEGSVAFSDTGATLKSVADTYDEEDLKYGEQLKNIW